MNVPKHYKILDADQSSPENPFSHQTQISDAPTRITSVNGGGWLTITLIGEIPVYLGNDQVSKDTGYLLSPSNPTVSVTCARVMDWYGITESGQSSVSVVGATNYH